ncbi:MAG: TonB-dependent receptor [Deltaproteobacteria bacterium]|nr:TonB-dependent receptor [Deltaproteobacteria bacterium]
MRMQRFVVAAFLGTTTLFGASLVSPSTARAQSSTTGAIQGVVKDKSTGEALPGVFITVVSANQKVDALTDENGFYKITELRPGTFSVTFFFANKTQKLTNINVGVNRTTPVFTNMDLTEEIVTVIGHVPTIDPTSTTQGITLDKEYTQNIPVPGRTFDSALGAAAGSQSDGVGVSFSGSSSLENQYVVDGVNTTGLGYGTVGSAVLNEFIDEIEVITGGYGAEFGRATGGVVNVVTKSGDNQLKGSVFASIEPGQLVAQTIRTPREATAIDAKYDLGYSADFGFDLGGPIIKDKVWFYVGAAPTFIRSDFTRTVSRNTDCRIVLPGKKLSECKTGDSTMGGYADTVADRDPVTGFYVTDLIESKVMQAHAQSYQMLGKVNFAVTPEHQGQVSVTAQPSSSRNVPLFGLPASNTYEFKSLTTNTSAKWTSKFNDNKTEVEGVLGWYRTTSDSGLVEDSLNNVPFQRLVFGNLSNWSGFGAESAAVTTACHDSLGMDGTDPYPGKVVNCPDTAGFGYSINGAGNLTHDKEQRLSARVSLTQRAKLKGSHEIKAGLDAEQNLETKTRLFSGGAAMTNYLDRSQVYVYRWVQLKPADSTEDRYDNMCANDGGGSAGMAGGKTQYQCDFLQGTQNYPGTNVEGNTLNWSAYLRDSYQPVPNLTLNLGLRYEEQRMRYAKALQNTIDPLTQESLGKNAMTLKGMIAPRLGALYDWTKEGRSKIYGHWGRFYENVPMDINDRSFGGEVSYRQVYGATDCSSTVDGSIGGVDGNNCLTTTKGATSDRLFGASGVLVAPGIKAQYMDEIILGVEYELMDDFKLGVSFQNRKLGRVIEDVSTDGANTYIIANPGEITDGDLADLERRIANTDDATEKARLTEQRDLFKGVRIFDKPKRDYNALQFTLTRRFAKNLYIQGSYTYSRIKGNYPGLISYDNGQIDPNISSQYDLIELLSNRNGPLPQDRPHYIKLDGYYTFDLKKAGKLTVGTRIRALSGIPRNVLGGHYLYGPDESFILPRGQIGRTSFDHGVDVHIGYARDLKKGMNLELYGDIFNLYNRQGEAGADDTYGSARYANNNVNPIVGGTYEDLIWARSVADNGTEQNVPLIRNKNFGNTTARYAPLSVRFGMRLTF